MTEAPTYLHPDDGDIIRWMDHAVPPAERANLEMHFASCANCQARRAALAHRTQRFGGLLRTTDIPAPATALRAVVRRRRVASTVGWRVAATILLVLGAATAVTPVRAWFAGVARTVWARFGETRKGAVVADGSVSFVPSSAQITIRVPRRAGSTLTVEVVDGDRVTALGSRDDVLVLPEEIRFSGVRQPADSYVVRVPLRDAVRVMVGQTAVQVLKPKTVGDRWVIPLDTAGN
jgi:hypothetical protein